MAKKIGVSASTVKRWINDGMVPGSDAGKLICGKLDLTYDELMGDEAPASQRREVFGAAINGADQAAAMDWLISRGKDADSVALAASIVARQMLPDEKRPKLWWVNHIDELLHELG
jgi:hypothetical protein